MGSSRMKWSKSGSHPDDGSSEIRPYANSHHSSSEGRLSASRRNSKFPGLLVALCSCVRRCWRCLPSPTELRAVDPHPMQDHRKPTRQCNDGLFDPVPFGDIHRPRFQPRPFLDADQQDLRRFIKKSPQHAVAAQRDMTYSTALARLVEYGRQPQYSPHCSQMAEAGRNVDRRGIGERDNRSDSGYRHQLPADRIDPGLAMDLAVQFDELLAQLLSGSEQRLDDFRQIGSCFNQLAYPFI